MIKTVQERITLLDSNLAEAIQTVIESKMTDPGIGMNPIMSVFADILKESVKKQTIEQVLPREVDGKFKKVIEGL